MVSPARQAAFDVLRSVSRGGFASDLLLKHSATLDPRDAALASEIVFGCLRRQAQLDHLIGCFVPRPLDPEVRLVLRMGVYQLRYLDRIPAHAAVSESVELTKRARKTSATGLVNAVLRKVDRQPLAWPDRATEFSTPAWLLDKWERQFGPELTETIASTFLKPVESHTATTGRIQDISAQSVVPHLDLQDGMTFLDVCAAPGNKTAQALEHRVRAVAGDISWSRLEHLRPLNCSLVVLDATEPLPFSAKFNRILVDVPCSGTGTLGRNPEIKWRLKASDLMGLYRRQVAILRNALYCLSRPGRLVYSTCSLEEEENQRVIEAVPGPWRVTQRIPGIQPGDGFFVAVLTSD